MKIKDKDGQSHVVEPTEDKPFEGNEVDLALNVLAKNISIVLAPNRFVLFCFADGERKANYIANCNLPELTGMLMEFMKTSGLNFQNRVLPWMLATFGEEAANDKVERNHRFLEESLELVQSLGCTQSEAHQLVDYVYGRPQGDVNQEAGGVMVTLAALCLASGINMHEAGDSELNRIWELIEQIRAKQAAKPKHSPLPA